jgi:hypothetical protein
MFNLEDKERKKKPLKILARAKFINNIIRCVYLPLVKLKTTTPITIKAPPRSWLAVGVKAKMAKEKMAVKNGSIVRIVAALETSNTCSALKNKMKLRKTPVIEPKKA